MEYRGSDGVRLAFAEWGQGRPIVLLHGRLDRGLEFRRSGVIDRLVAVGYRTIVPDLRGHGDSAKPHDAASWPADVHTDDALALVAHLALADYDLAGHSLGARTALRMLVRGADPRRAVVSGLGLNALTHATQNTDWMRRFLSACGQETFAPGSDERETEEWMRGTNVDARAVLASLDSYVDTSLEELARVRTPTLVLTGHDDQANETAAALADALGDARHVEVPGDHFSAKASPQFAEALITFLTAGRRCDDGRSG